MIRAIGLLVAAAALGPAALSVSAQTSLIASGDMLLQASAAEDAQVSASGITGVVKDETRSRRFWVSFDRESRTWLGGHTAPADGVLPVTGGSFKYGPSGIVLYNSDGKLLGLVNAFKDDTKRGETGRGHIEDPPNVFSWTAI